MSSMTREAFQELLVPITDYIGDRTLDTDLEADLNKRFSPDSDEFKAVEAACHAAIDDGWMCKYEGGGIKYGRVIKPARALHGFSVDVVDMKEVKGPHHRHPQGEVDMVMPQEGDARFDGQGAGWKVFPADSAH